MQRVLAQFDRRRYGRYIPLPQRLWFDIEYTDEVCHVVGIEDKNGNEVDVVGAFEGIIIKLPLLSIYLGSWDQLDVRMLDT